MFMGRFDKIKKKASSSFLLNVTESTMAFPWVRTSSSLLGVLLLLIVCGLGEPGVVIQNQANETAVTVAVYDGSQAMVLEVGLLDAGSIIEWDAKSVPTNYSSLVKSSPPVPMEHLFVIRNANDNVTVTSQYFYDDTTITVLDDSMGGLSIKATGGSS